MLQSPGATARRNGAMKGNGEIRQLGHSTLGGEDTQWVPLALASALPPTVGLPSAKERPTSSVRKFRK